MNNSVQRGLEKMQESEIGREFRKDTIQIIEKDKMAKETIHPESTTKCNECYYFKSLYGHNTCGLYHSMLSNNVSGCYGGWKTRNISYENKEN